MPARLAACLIGHGVDNSELREQARQRRQEQARLQQPPEKQPANTLFGPPIRVSRPNDPTFKQLSTFFGPYHKADVSQVFEHSFSSPAPNDASPTAENHNRRQTDVRPNNNNKQNDYKHTDTRPTDTRTTDTRTTDGRPTDTRHNDTRPSDTRNGHTTNRTSKNSRSNHDTVTAPDSNSSEPARQGVFEQFVKSDSKSLSRINPSQSSSSENRHSDKSARHAKTDTTNFKSSCQQDGKMKHKTVAAEPSRTDNLVKESRSDETVCNSTNSLNVWNHPKPNGAKLATPSSKSFSSPVQNLSPIPASTSTPNSNMHDVRNELKNSSRNQRDGATIKDHGKVFPVETNQTGRPNGSMKEFQSGRNGSGDKKLSLVIQPPHSEGHGKFDDFVTKLIQEVSIPSPLTGIVTPKKTDGLVFPFPPSSILSDRKTIPKSHLSDEDDDDDDADDEGNEGRHLQQQQQLPQSMLGLPVKDSHKAMPKQSPDKSVRSQLEDDLDLSESSEDSDEEQVRETRTAQRPPAVTSQFVVTDQKPNPVEGQGRRGSVSSATSSEESSESDSESDSSLSENEAEKVVKKVEMAMPNDDDDENDDKQSKRPSWEIKNFIPIRIEQVPFMSGPSFMSSSSSSPLLSNRQPSHDDFDNDMDHVFSPRLLPLPIPKSDIDIVQLLSPSIDRKDQISPLLNLRRALPIKTEHMLDGKTCSQSVSVAFPAAIFGVDYRNGKPSVVVRIRRSALTNKHKTMTKVAGTDDSGVGLCKTAVCSAGKVSVFSKSATRTDCQNASQHDAPAEPDVAKNSSLETESKPCVLVNSSLTKTPSKRSRLDGQPIQPTSGNTKHVPSGVASISVDNKQQRVETSPSKIKNDKTGESYPITSKPTKRKLDEVSRSDPKRICERNPSNSKEDRRSQLVTQNDDQLNGQRSQNGQLKSPNVDNNNLKPSSQATNVQKRTEKSKNGYSKSDDKPKKTAASKDTISEPLNNASMKTVKAETPLAVNGIERSPAYLNNICDSVNASEFGNEQKRSAQFEEDEQPLDRRKEPPNGIKRVKQRLESSEFYMQQARKLKHEGDSGPDKFLKGICYTESVLAFMCHCTALEIERAESARITKMYQDTLGLCQYIIRVMDSVVSPGKYHLIVISLRMQSIISLQLYNTRRTEVTKLKTVLDEHNKSHVSKPLQIPSPYQTNHHHHANGTPSPRSPRPSPSPAGSIGSVGSAGSSNGDSGMAKPSVNGYNMTSIVVPQRIHSVMMNFLNHMNYLHQCHDYWDQAEAVLIAHPTVGEFFHSMDTELGPIDLHSSTLTIVHYASEVVNRVRSDAKRLSQTTRPE